MEKTIGFIGLGHMGMNLALHLQEKGYSVIAWNRSPEPRAEADKAGIKTVETLQQLIAALPKPRVAFSMVSAGEAVDFVLQDCLKGDAGETLEAGDVFIDGANSHYRDSIRRANMLAQKGIEMLDCGISGGLEGARNGVCLMVGGDKEIFDLLEPLFKDISLTNGYGYFGKNGAGHFVKMVHNAIEYGMMESIGEGLNLLAAGDYPIDYSKLTEVWGHGSIIEGKLIGFLNEAFKRDNQLEQMPGAIGSLGTGKWAVNEALDREVPFTAIAHSVLNRYSSRGNSEFAFKVISAMRATFGAHTELERDANFVGEAPSKQDD